MYLKRREKIVNIIDEKNLNTKSIFLSILGNANVGKSSLLNMILGKKISIVSPKPQTTRNRINGIYTDGRIQIVFTDIPGFLSPKTTLEHYMNHEIYSAAKGSDACLYMIEAGKNLLPREKIAIEKLKKMKIPIVVAINKIDLVKNKPLLLKQIDEISQEFLGSDILLVSARTGSGVNELLDKVKKLAKPSVFYFENDKCTDQSEGNIIREIIREKLLYFLDKEVPHGVAVVVDSIEKSRENKLNISCVIYCERDGHKGIIVGKHGLMIKKIGIFARKDIESFTKMKVNLNIWVKTKKNWKNKESVLKELGYTV